MSNISTLEQIARNAIESTQKTQEDLLSKVKRKVKTIEKKGPIKKGPIKPEERRLVTATVVTTDVVADDVPTNMFVSAIKDMNLTETEANKVAVAFSGFKNNISYNGILMKCPGHTDKSPCPHFNMCPFSEIDKYPTGGLCPLEKLIADREMSEYLKQINKNPNELPLSIINMLYTLIECDLTEIRMRNRIHTEGYVVKKQVFVLSGKDGQIIEQDDISKAFEIQERVARRKEIIMKSLLFTPEIRRKYDVSDTNERIISPSEAILIAKKTLADKKK